MLKNDTPPFWVENHVSFVFYFILSRKSISGSRLHGVCLGLSGTSAGAVYALSAFFAMLGVSATSLTPWYPLYGV